MFNRKLSIGSHKTNIAVLLNGVSRIGDLLRSADPERTYHGIVVVTDETVGRLYGDTVLASLRREGFRVESHLMEPGEASKSIESLIALYDFLAERRIGRDSLLLALGGGVVSDLTGFAAATWMRGVDFVICPTTLEAAIDASIGGKTAINRPGGKNQVGAFHQPMLVVVDPACLQTLEPRDIRAGLAESIKHALIADKAFLDWQEQRMEAILSLDNDVVTELIARNIEIKCAVVERDPFERAGDRMILNFGHTIGHAVEQCCDYTLRHGECVALGMVAACRISESMGLLAADVVERVKHVLELAGLPTRLTEPINVDRIMQTMMSDKKVRSGSARFVLLNSIGCPVIRDDIPESVVRAAYASIT